MAIDSGTIAFLERLNEDDSVRSELAAALAGAQDKTGAAVAFAGSKGFKIDRTGFDEARAALIGAVKAREALSDKDLNAVAGGFNPQPDPPGRVSYLLTKIRFDPRVFFGW
jgi:predicted ribosomally synthesized peptide with nif11-like leader